MKRTTHLPLLIGFLATWLLTGCHPGGALELTSTPTPMPSWTPVTKAPATEAGAATPRQTVVTATSIVPAPPIPTTAHTPVPTPTASPSPAPTMTPRPTPALSPPVVGEPLAFSLGWRVDANGHLTAAAVDLGGSRPQISLASLGRAVYRLDGDGGVRWRASTRGPVYALALLAGGRLAVGDDAGTVTVLDSRGQPVWRAELGSRVTALHAAPGAELLAGGWDERLSLFDAEGQARWQVPIGAPVSSITTWVTEGAGSVLVAALDGQVRAFDLEGAELWRFDAGSAVSKIDAVPAKDQALVLVGVQDGRLLALDGSGALHWQRALGTGAPVWCGTAQLDGDALGVVAGTGGASATLTLLSAEDGQARWRIGLPASARAIISLDLDADGRLEILAGLADGQVQAYDLQGRLRSAVHAGLSVWGLYPVAEGSALVVADVAAWQVVGRPGPAGGPWLSPPAMLPAPAGAAPPPIGGEPEGGILVFLGDVAFGRSMEAQLARYGPAYPWQGLGALLHGEAPGGLAGSQDLPVLTIVNLECTLTTQGELLDKSYLIRAHPLWAQSLAAAGIDLVTLANNHALDFGLPGLEETVGTLGGLGIKVVGAGISAGAAHRPAFLDVGGVRVAFLGYAAARWDGSVDVPATDRLAWACPGDIQADVEAVRDQADIVVVLLHAGTEYAVTPSADQVAAAHAAIDAGADLVVGHHPHVTQTVERYRQGLIVYSLGDAVFDIPRPAAMRGHLLRVQVSTSGLAGAELWPFWIDEAIQPRLLDSGQGTPRVKPIYP